MTQNYELPTIDLLSLIPLPALHEQAVYALILVGIPDGNGKKFVGGDNLDLF